MIFRSDSERGQSVVIGTILVFSVIVLFLIYTQVALFPAKNEQAEKTAFNKLSSDFLELDGSVQDSVAYRTASSVTFRTTVSYPPQIISPYNPPEPIELKPLRSAVRLQNSSDTLMWDTDTLTVVSSPSYIEYNAPKLIYEHGIVVTRDQGTEIPKTSQSIVYGTNISLVFISSEPRVLKSPGTQLEATPIYTRNSQTVTSSQSGNLTLTLKTRLSNSTWQSLLSGQLTENGGNIQQIEFRDNKTPNRVFIEFVPNKEYTVKWSKISLSG